MKNILRAARRLLTNAWGIFTPSETIWQSKIKWSGLAREDAKYYIWSEKKNSTDEEFRNSGREDYNRYIKQDIALQNRLKISDVKTVLEIGCGIGRMTEFFGDDFDAVYGIDIAREMLEKAKERLPDKKFMFLESDGVRLPVDSETVDFVFSFIVFQHMPSVKVVRANFSEANRVLKHDGIFKVQLRGKKVDRREWFYGVSFNPEQARQLAVKAGFEILNIWQETERYLWLTLRKR